jgi:2-oxoglutarate dehydrogenase E2 component (dihydrolipoamide succinyltransferase)
MARVELVMPKMGESIMEATIISWSKKPGDAVAQDETVLEIATDKVDSEVPSPVAGVLTELLFKDGDVVPVGTVIAYLETESAAAGATPVAAAPVAQPVAQPIAQPLATAPSNGNGAAVLAATAAVGAHAGATAALLEKPQSGRFYSPLVLNIARTEGIGSAELERIPGTGQDGRVSKKDILAYVQQRTAVGSQPSAISNQPPSATNSKPVASSTSVGSGVGLKWSPAQVGGFEVPAKTYSYTGAYDIEEMDRMRRMIADNMVYSKHMSPHVTSWVEADVTSIVKWRERNKNAFEKKYGTKLTFTPFFVEAIARALREMPRVNVSVDGYNIILKKEIHISMAVALPSGNLIAPTIRNADQLNLAGLSVQVNDLADRARNNKLKPEDMADGTYTISNVGTFGNVMGTPIIVQPQVAIMAVGAIRKKPAVIETPEGDLIGIRHLMFLSHSYDHRVIDGALGGSFVQRVATLLEGFDPKREV